MNSTSSQCSDTDKTSPFFTRWRTETTSSMEDSDWPDSPSTSFQGSDLASVYALNSGDRPITTIDLSENGIRSLRGICYLNPDPIPDLIPRNEHYIPKVYQESVESGEDDVFVRSRSQSVQDIDSIYSEDELDGRLSGRLSVSDVVAQRLAFLENLDLSHNYLYELAFPVMTCLTNLQTLNASFNCLQKFPFVIMELTKLTSINMSNNKIQSFDFDDTMPTLPNLETLNLSSNSLSSIPSGLGRVTPQLLTLDLSCNHIEAFPDEALYLQALVSLNVSFNLLQTIPEKFLEQLSSLEKLSLSGNRLNSLPTSPHIPICLGNLKTLDVSHNNLSENAREPFFIPKFILELPGLIRVNISHNGLQGLPSPFLWASLYIQSMNASHNEISQINIGDTCRNWQTMENLNLSNNQLKRLPKEIGRLTSLSSLNISYNSSMTTLPDELGKLSKLWELNLDGLTLNIDPILVRGRTRDLIGYLHEKLKKSVEYHRVKMMVVGYGGRGKSTLVSQLMKTKPPSSMPPTVGFVIKEWKFATVRKKRYVTQAISMWDFAGQEEFHSQHQCFLFSKALYLVVYNLSFGSAELETLKPWLLNIQAHAPKCPVIVVGTHKDRVDEENRIEAIREMRSNIIAMFHKPGFPSVRNLHFAEVSCGKELSGLNRLRQLIRHVANNFTYKDRPVMGQMIPESYLKLHTQFTIEAKKINPNLPIITQKRVNQMVKEARIDLDGDELRQAIRFLHETGVVLHYEDSSSHLNELYVLDPEWLCRMMAQVIAVREINPFVNEQGILRKDALGILFNGKSVHHHDNRFFTFPPQRIPQYLRLLEKFEVALPLNDQELLIPSKLPDKIPKFEIPFKASLVRRHYDMQYLPIGFWSRLLIRLLVLGRTYSQTLSKIDDIECEDPDAVYWKKGAFIRFNPNLFFLVSSSQRRSIECLEVAVTPCRQGARLLGQVVDLIDSLIEEWYPGLLDVSPSGRWMVRCRAPCISCPLSRPHMFLISDLLKQSETSDEIVCPKHADKVPLALLAPDTVFGDLERKYVLDQSQLELTQSPEFLLGDGSYGSVYKGKYKEKQVAIKIYQPFGDVPVHKLIRQEATILQTLNHASILHLIGVSSRPWRLVLELAPHGSLDNVLKGKEPLSRQLQHRMAYQIADGLQYLHSQQIVYRDLKPGNILVFSLVSRATVNVKISDYGIAQVASPFGLSSAEGTPGYRAPEVIKGESYLYQADIFSFGIVLHQLVTSGQPPYARQFRHEMDTSVMREEVIQPLSIKGFHPWPDIEDLIVQCVQQIPDDRPTSKEIVEYLRDVELVCLRLHTPVSKTSDIDVMSHQIQVDGGKEVWLSCGISNCSQLSWLNLDTALNGFKSQDMKVKVNTCLRVAPHFGTLFTETRILSMCSVGEDHVIVGTQTGSVWVYESDSHQVLHCLPRLSDSIVSMLHYKHRTTPSRDYILAGLANGELVVFDTHDLLTSDSTRPLAQLKVGENWEAVMTIVVGSNKKGRFYVTAGSTIRLIRIEEQAQIDRSVLWDTANQGGHPGTIQYMERYNKVLHLTKRSSSVLECWSTARKDLVQSLDLSLSLYQNTTQTPIEPYHCRITAMRLVDLRTLWLGCANGKVFLVDQGSYQVLKTIKDRFVGPVRCINHVQMGGFPGTLVMVAGWGFVAKSYKYRRAAESEILECEKEGACLTVWDSSLIAEEEAIAEDVKARNQWTSDMMSSGEYS